MWTSLSFPVVLCIFCGCRSFFFFFAGIQSGCVKFTLKVLQRGDNLMWALLLLSLISAEPRKTEKDGCFAIAPSPICKYHIASTQSITNQLINQHWKLILKRACVCVCVGNLYVPELIIDSPSQLQTLLSISYFLFCSESITQSSISSFKVTWL